MKTVFTDISKVAHLWANKVQQSARNRGNFYFEGDTIYSYGSHFPIAKHVTNDKGETGILFTERGYSSTTSKHIWVVRDASRHLNIIKCYNPQSSHRENFEYWLSNAEGIAAHLTTARKPEKYLSGIDHIKANVEKYAAFFDIAIPEILAKVLAIGNKDEYANYADNKAKYLAKEEKKRQAELKKRHKKELEKWLNGEGHRLYVHDGYDYLRVKDGRIQTTQAVELPLELGRRLWQNIKSDSVKVGDKVLDYTVNEVGKTYKIGCHTYKRDYLIKFGDSVFN